MFYIVLDHKCKSNSKCKMCKMVPDQSDDVLSVTASDLKKLTMESRLFLICYSTKVFDSHQGESGYIRKERDEHFQKRVFL